MRSDKRIHTYVHTYVACINCIQCIEDATRRVRNKCVGAVTHCVYVVHVGKVMNESRYVQYNAQCIAWTRQTRQRSERPWRVRAFSADSRSFTKRSESKARGRRSSRAELYGCSWLSLSGQIDTLLQSRMYLYWRSTNLCDPFDRFRSSFVFVRGDGTGFKFHDYYLKK